jgi:hypothetical protein
MPAVGNLQAEKVGAVPAQTTFGELVECWDILQGKLQMPQLTS